MSKLFGCIITALLFTPLISRGQASLNVVDSLMSRAVEKSEANRSQYSAFQSLIEEECTAVIQKIPFDIWPLSGIVIPAKKDSGIVYVSQAKIRAHYLNDRHYRQEVIRKQEAGRLPIPNWNQLSAYDFSLYNKRIYLAQTFDRGFISPLSKEGLRIYNYKILEEKIVERQKAYRISFSPRNRRLPALQGEMLLQDHSFLVLESDFNISADNQLELLDSIHIIQKYQFKEGDYVLHQQQIELHLNLFSYQGFYRIHHRHRDFSFQKDLSKKDFDALVYRMKPEDLDTTFKPYWSISQDQNRVFEERFLNPNTAKQYRFFNTSRLDPQNFRWYKPLYKGFTFGKGDWFFDLPPLYRGLGFNAVEGPYLRAQFKVGRFKPFNEWGLRGQLRYGISDNRVKPLAELSWRYGKKQPSEWSISLGSDYRQYNEDEPILPVLNTVYGLLLAENYINLFGVDFTKIAWKTEAIPGLSLASSLEYAWRYPLFNNTSFNLIGSERPFRNNNQDFGPGIDRSGFRAHRSLKWEVNLSYQFQARYEQRYKQRFQDVYQGRKNLEVRAPKVYYDMRMGIASPISDTRYLFHTLGIQHQFRWGNLGLSQFDLSVGHFVFQDEVPFLDYNHFNGIQIFFLQPAAQRSAMIKQFSTLPYYDYSTTAPYAEFHFEHHFDGALMAQLKGVRNYKVHMLTGFNALYVQGQLPFPELFIGFDNIFKVFRLEFAGGLDQFSRFRPAVRLGFDFNFDYYQKNR